MSETIPQITIKYIGTKSLEDFAKSLGINANRQSVWHWKEGERTPEVMTLFRVIGSPTSTFEAKEWARECLMVLQAAAGMEFEPTLDEEIEHRR